MKAVALLAALCAGCVSPGLCPAPGGIRRLLEAEVVTRYSCRNGDEVQKTVDAISAWRCSREEEFFKTLPGGVYTQSQEDCLFLADQVTTLLQEGLPSAWGCSGTSPDTYFRTVCDRL